MCVCVCCSEKSLEFIPKKDKTRDSSEANWHLCVQYIYYLIYSQYSLFTQRARTHTSKTTIPLTTKCQTYNGHYCHFGKPAFRLAASVFPFLMHALRIFNTHIRHAKCITMKRKTVQICKP